MRARVTNFYLTHLMRNLKQYITIVIIKIPRANPLDGISTVAVFNGKRIPGVVPVQTRIHLQYGTMPRQGWISCARMTSNSTLGITQPVKTMETVVIYTVVVKDKLVPPSLAIDAKGLAGRAATGDAKNVLSCFFIASKEPLLS